MFLCVEYLTLFRNMELKEFIKGTITAIAESVEELNLDLKDQVEVNPKGVHSLGDCKTTTDVLVNVLEYHEGTITPKWCTLIQNIEFNLVITEAKSNQKGGGLRIEVFSAGVNTKKEIENMNTVKFSIPISLKK